MNSGIDARAAVREDRMARPPRAVTSYIHKATRSAWLDVAGKSSRPASLRVVLGQLRRAHRRIPRGVDFVAVDLTRLDEITMDLVVLLSVESRMLGLRDMRLAVVLRDAIKASPSAEQVLESLQVWRVADDRLVDLTTAASQARLGADGWQPAGTTDVTPMPLPV